jgi:hypothetical protein
VKGPGRSRSRINTTGWATDTGTGGAAEAAAETGSTAPTLSSRHSLGSINTGSATNAGGAVPVKGPVPGCSSINLSGATDAGTGGTAELGSGINTGGATNEAPLLAEGLADECGAYTTPL